LGVVCIRFLILPKFVLPFKDPNDDNIILGIPEDIDPSTLPSDEPVRKVKIIQKHVKKSRMLLNRLENVNFYYSASFFLNVT
jgi:hypothetical protein